MKTYTFPIVRIVDLQNELVARGVMSEDEWLPNILYGDEYVCGCYKDFWIDDYDWDLEWRWSAEHFQGKELQDRLHELEIRKELEAILSALNLGDRFLLDIDW